MDIDDDELAGGADLDDGFGGGAVERTASDDTLDFARLGVALAGRDLACEDDAFEIKDVEVVIFKLFRCMD